MAKSPQQNSSQTKLTKAQIKERAESHPAAVPFLWLDDPNFRKNFYLLPLIGTIVFSILGFVYPLKHPAPWDVVPFSYAIFGFVAYSFVVLASWPLFKLLGRPEDYYGEDDSE